MELVISVASVVIACCALASTFWQLKIQRQHNHISVRPHLCRFTKRKLENNNAYLEVILVNNGLGPAFINSFDIYYRDKLCDPDVVIKEVFSELGCNFSHTILGDDYAMPPKSEKALLALNFLALSEVALDEMEGLINKIDIVINYSSAYASMVPLDTRDDR